MPPTRSPPRSPPLVRVPLSHTWLGNTHNTPFNFPLPPRRRVHDGKACGTDDDARREADAKREVAPKEQQGAARELFGPASRSVAAAVATREPDKPPSGSLSTRSNASASSTSSPYVPLSRRLAGAAAGEQSAGAPPTPLADRPSMFSTAYTPAASTRCVRAPGPRMPVKRNACGLIAGPRVRARP